MENKSLYSNKQLELNSLIEFSQLINSNLNLDFILGNILLSIMGLVDSLYLTWIKLSENQTLCIKGLGDCWSVNTSRYSELFGIPVAVYGAATYLVILLILLFESKITLLKENAAYFLFAISLFGTIYSFYLTYLEIAVIKAICPFCILSAVIMTTLFILTIVRMLRTQDDKIAF